MTTNKPPTEPLPIRNPLVIAARATHTLSPRGILVLHIVLALVTVSLIVLDAIFRIFAPITDAYAAMWNEIINWIFVMMDELNPSGRGW